MLHVNLIKLHIDINKLNVNVNNSHININKKHLDASVKEWPQTLLVPLEQICKRVLCNKYIQHHLLFQTDKF